MYIASNNAILVTSGIKSVVKFDYDEHVSMTIKYHDGIGVNLSFENEEERDIAFGLLIEELDAVLLTNS